MSRLPQIAIALAVVAVVMVALAIYVVSTRDDEPAPAPTRPADAALAPPIVDDPRTATVDPWADSTSDAAVDAVEPAIDDDAATAQGCPPCGAQCTRTCTCKDGATSTTFQCQNGCCVVPTDACADACRGHGGPR